MADASIRERAAALHDDAEKLCFIARSVNFPVHHRPVARLGFPRAARIQLKRGPVPSCGPDIERYPSGEKRRFPVPASTRPNCETREMGGCDSDVRALELAPQRFPGSLSQGGIDVGQGMEDRLLQLQRAFHSIAEKHHRVLRPKRRRSRSGQACAQVCRALSARRVMGCMSPSRGSSRPAAARTSMICRPRSSASAPVTNSCQSAHAVADDGVGKIRSSVHDEPANVVDVKVAAHHGVDIFRRGTCSPRRRRQLPPHPIRRRRRRVLRR